MLETHHTPGGTEASCRRAIIATLRAATGARSTAERAVEKGCCLPQRAGARAVCIFLSSLLHLKGVKGQV